jgi:hypothetical protein
MALLIEDDVDDVDGPPWMVSGGARDGGRPMFDDDRRGEGPGRAQ